MVTDPATLATEIDALDETWQDQAGEDGTGPHLPSYNVAPTTRVPVVVSGGGARRIRCMRWGLVPSWARDLSGPPLFNARSETAHEKPAFRDSFASMRALIPMDGWYEWANESDRFGRTVSRPRFLSPTDGGRLYVAGLWSYRRHPQRQSRLFSCAVLTTAAVGELKDVHDRMPVILPAERWERWLDPSVPADPALLEPAAESLARIGIRPVSTRVNDVRNDGPGLVTARSPGSSDDQVPGVGEQFTLL